MDNIPKVIVFADHTAKLGGGELALLNLITHLDKSTYTPVVVLASDGPLVSRLTAVGVETHILPLQPTIVDTRKDAIGLRTLLQGQLLKQCLSYAIRLAWFARARGADLIHTNSLKSDIYGGLAGRLAGIPVLWHVRDHIDSEYLPRGAAAAFRWLTRIIPNTVVANSQSTQKRLRIGRSTPVAVVHSGIADASVLGHMAVIHDGLNPKNYVTEIEKKSFSSDPVVVLVGRIAEWKGQHIFLRAAASVLRDHPNTQFQIVGAPLFGEYDYERSLHSLVEELGIKKYVKFLGFREDISTILANSDIMVHASTLGEPFGQVVIEGMAAGKPVIATDGGALPEIVEPGRTGLLVPMGDAEAMAEAISSLLADPARGIAMGQEGRQRVLERFTIAHTVTKVQAIYERMLVRRRPHPQSTSGLFRDFGQLALSGSDACGSLGQLALPSADAGQDVMRATIVGNDDNAETRGNYEPFSSSSSTRPLT